MLPMNTPIASQQKGKTTTTTECPGYDTKQLNGEVPVMLELWGMLDTTSFPLLPGPLWPGLVAPDRGQIAPDRTKLCTYTKLNCLKYNCICIKMDLVLIAYNG